MKAGDRRFPGQIGGQGIKCIVNTFYEKLVLQLAHYTIICFIFESRQFQTCTLVGQSFIFTIYKMYMGGGTAFFYIPIKYHTRIIESYLLPDFFSSGSTSQPFRMRDGKPEKVRTAPCLVAPLWPRLAGGQTG